MKNKVIINILVVIAFLNNYTFAQDTIDVAVQLKHCYQLNKQRDTNLIVKAKALIPIAERYPKSNFAVKVYTLVGRGFLNFLKVDSCPKYFELAYKNVGPKVSTIAIAHLNLSSGTSDYMNYRFKSSLQKAVTAYKCYAVIQDTLGMTWASTNIANVLIVQGNYIEGIKYLKQSLNYASLTVDSFSMANTSQSIGAYYFRLKQLDSSLNYHLNCLNIFKKIGGNNDLALAYANIAACYKGLGYYSQAIQNAKQSQILAKKIGIQLYFNLNASTLASCYDALGKSDLAISFADSAISNLRYLAPDETNIMVLQVAKNIYSKNKLYEKALLVSELYDSLLASYSDSLINSAIGSQEAEYRFESQKLEIQNLKDLQQKQADLKEAQDSNLLLSWVVGILLLAALVIISFLYRNSRKTSKELDKKNKQIDQQLLTLQEQSEIQLMTIGIVGHDLRGPISTIVKLKPSLLYLSEKGKTKELDELLEAVFTNLAKVLNLSNNLVDWVLSSRTGLKLVFQMVNLREIALETLEMLKLSIVEKNLSIEVNIEENHCAYMDDACLKTILRNLVQNAIKFTPEGGEIIINTLESENDIELYIKDNGVGIKEATLAKIMDGKQVYASGTQGEKGSGLGLIMVRSLLLMNNCTMEIESEVGKGTTFALFLPKCAKL